MDENLKMVRGDTFEFSVEIEGLDEDLTSASFSAKKNKNDTEYIFQKTLGHGITKVKEGVKENNIPYRVYQVKLASEDTESINMDTDAFYDLEMKTDEDVFTPLIGILTIIEDVSK